MDLIKYLAGEWAVISGAPVTFIIAAALIVVATAAVVRSVYRERMETLRDRLTLRDERTAELERKLTEVKKSLEAPPPQVQDKGNGGQQYSAVLSQLTHLYVLSHDGISSAMLAGMELPPKDWLNAELAKMGENWRVHEVRGALADIQAA